MLRFAARRLIGMIAVLFAISVIVFLIFNVIPNSDPAARIAGKNANPALIARVSADLGLDRPLPVQYLTMMKQIFTGELTSYASSQNVAEQIWDGLPATLSLCIGAAVLWMALAVWFGYLSAVRAGRFTDRALDQIAALFNEGDTNWHKQHDVYSTQGGLPLGRAFKAAVEPMPGYEGGKQVRVWWYYLKGDPEGDRCERYIAAQIWRELSISCWVRSFTADVDGKRIGYGDECSDYYPGQKLSDGRVVVGIMDDVIELEEFSLVSRGAEIETTIEGAEVYSTANAVALARKPREWKQESGADRFRAYWNGGTAAERGTR